MNEVIQTKFPVVTVHSIPALFHLLLNYTERVKFQKFGGVRFYYVFLKEVSNSHEGYIYLIKNTVKYY